MNIDEPINQDATFRYAADLLDEARGPLTLAELTAVKLTWTDAETGDVVNGRDAQDVLGANGVAIDAAARLTWTGTPLDSPILHASTLIGGTEERIALLEWRWAGGAKVGRYRRSIRVRRLY